MKKNNLFKYSALSAAILASLAACGGGSDSTTTTTTSTTTISGVAAAGAPLAGTVTVKDSTGATKSVAIGTNGRYSVDVAGMTAPFMFRAEGTVGGRTYIIHSAATAADINGNINITTLTDLIIANIAGQIASSYFNSGNFSGISTATLNAQETQLQTRLQTVLTAVGVDGAIDLLRSSFSPDHTKLDAALDILRVETNAVTNTATITNLLNATQTITDDLTVTTDTSALPDPGNLTIALTDLQALAQTMSNFSALFATALPTNTAIAAMLDSGFLNDDADGATFAANLSTYADLIGASFTNVAIDNLDTTNGIATVSFSIIKNGSVMDKVTAFKLKKQADNSWKLYGNQMIVNLNWSAHMLRNTVDVMTNTTYDTTGVELWLENPNIMNDGGTISSVVVTGPGLGTNGITYTPQSSSPSDHYLISSGTACRTTTPALSYCLMDNDADITAIPDNAQYTIAVYVTGNPTPVATYTRTLKKRPYTNAELPNVAWPQVSITSINAFINYTGGNLALTATLPADAASAWGRISYTDSNGKVDTVDDGGLNIVNNAVTMSANFTITPLATITHLEAHVSYQDSYGREIGRMANRN